MDGFPHLGHLSFTICEMDAAFPRPPVHLSQMRSQLFPRDATPQSLSLADPDLGGYPASTQALQKLALCTAGPGSTVSMPSSLRNGDRELEERQPLRPNGEILILG